MNQLNRDFFRRIFLLIFVFCFSLQTSFAQNCITLSTNIASNTNITYGVDKFTLKVEFDKPMDPVVSLSFSEDLSFAFNGIPSHSWSADAKTYTLQYTVGSFSQTAYNVYAEVEGTTTGGENVKCSSPTFYVDKAIPPSCAISFTPEVIYDGATTFKITLLYDTEMDITSIPSITFGNFLDYALTFTNPQHAWEADKKTCIITYTVVDQNAQNANILITADQAKSSTGKQQAACDATKPLFVDMLDFVVTADANAPSINCNSSKLLVTVKFNQPMTEITNNIVSFPNIDPQGFLTFSKIEWTNNKEAVFEYSVHPDVAANHPEVDIAVAPIKNTFGREYSGGTFSKKFSVISTPPVITNITSQSPKCHNDENGEITLTVSGGVSPLKYVWLKNDAAFSATAASATNLGAGKYDVTVEGADNCLAKFSANLTNPEAIVLTAEVIHHLEKYLDGEITLAASGGTLPYSYSVNNDNKGDKSNFTNLDAGTYNFKVTDVNNCFSLVSAEVRNYQAPTIFTPNGDGHNDTFMEGNTVEIFDRNGTLIHKGNNGWDGRYKGQIVRPAIYFYIATFPDGFKKKGSIQVYKQ